MQEIFLFHHGSGIKGVVVWIVRKRERQQENDVIPVFILNCL